MMADAAQKLAWLKAQLSIISDDNNNSSSSDSGSSSDGDTATKPRRRSPSTKVKDDDSDGEENEEKQRPRRSSRSWKRTSSRKKAHRHSESDRNSESESEEDPTSPTRKRVRKKEDRKSKAESSKIKKRASGRSAKESGIESERDAEQQTKTKKMREQVAEERERLKQEKAEQRERIRQEKADIREMAMKVQERVKQEKAEFRTKKLEAAAMMKKEKAHRNEMNAVPKKHQKVPKKPVSSDDEDHSSSSESDDHESPVEKVKKIRKREIASKERHDVVFAGIDVEFAERDAGVVKDERAVKRSKASAAAHAGERRDDGSSRSRKRPLARSNTVKDGKLMLNESSADIRDRSHSTKEKARGDEHENHKAEKSSATHQGESAPTSSVPNDKNHRKEDGVVKASIKRALSQEEEDRRLAIALSSRKSERARKRTLSNDSTASVDRAAQVAERVMKKRKRDVNAEISGVDKPEKPKSKKSSASALPSVTSAVTLSSVEKVTPTKKIRQKVSADASPSSAADPVKAETKRMSTSPRERQSDRAERHHLHKEDSERKSVRSKVRSQSESDRVLVKKSRKKSMESGDVEESAKERQKAGEVGDVIVDPAEEKDDAMPANKPGKSPKGTMSQTVDTKPSEQAVEDECVIPGAASRLSKLEVKEESVNQVPKSLPAVVEPDTDMGDSVDEKKPESKAEPTVPSSPKPTISLPVQEEKPVEVREEGEEAEEGVVAESYPKPKQEAKPDDAKPESKTDVKSEPVDPMSFVIPKKKIQRKPQTDAPQNAAANATLPPAISVTTKPAPGSSPLARDLESKEANLMSNARARAQARAPPRRKNYVPVAATPLTREEKEFMRRSKKLNSLLGACNRSPRMGDAAGPYAIFDSNGNAIPDFLPRMKCPTKKQLKVQSAEYPASFFGVEMEPLSAADADADAETDLSLDPDGTTLKVEINIYEPLEFARPSDREAYQKKMYGTTFVPQLLRGRTTLVMRNVVFERKSTGIRFNADRDREEFAKALSERFTINKSVPRCEIPPKNWQQLMNKRPAVVYVHYQNREDGELAAQICRDDKNVLLERKRTNRVGGIISASNSPAPQTTPRRSLSTDRSGPEASPPVSNRNAPGLDSKSTPQPWQPHNDQRRRDDDNGARGPRDWPPRYNDRSRGGGGHDSCRTDRSRDRDHSHRHQMDQRFGSGDDEMNQQGRRRSRSRSRPRHNSAREYLNDENSYRWADGDAGRRGEHSQEYSDHRDSQNHHSENSGSESNSQSRSQSQQHTQDGWGSESQGDAQKRTKDTHDYRDRSGSVGKQNDPDANGNDPRDRRDSQERAEQEERSENEDREGGADSEMRRREQSPNQERQQSVKDGNDDRYHSQEYHQHRSGSFDRRRDDDAYYRNDHVNDARDGRDTRNSDFEFHHHHGHSRRHSGRSRSRPRASPHTDRAASYRHDHEPEFGHGRHGGGHFDSGEFNGRNSHHYPHDRERAFHRNGPRDDGYPRQRSRPY
ncbi:hypothetical protein FI667_g8366, partial [Globisporangium splendens]